MWAKRPRLPPPFFPTHILESMERTTFHTLFPASHVAVTRGRAGNRAGNRSSFFAIYSGA